VKSYFGLRLPETLDEYLDPHRLALVVYDMQVGICSQVSGAVTVVRAVQSVLETARSAGVRVVFTRHMSLPKELMGAMAYRTAMTWQRKKDPDEITPWFLRDSPGFALTPELQPRQSEVIFDKTTFSAFEGTPLGATLRDCGVTTVAFAGIALEVGIDPSVRHAADLGFVPVIISDACGFGNPEAGARALEAIRYAGDTIITDVRSVLAALGQTQKSAVRS
jgi:nicotinamidase-related amidase